MWLLLFNMVTGNYDHNLAQVKYDQQVKECVTANTCTIGSRVDSDGNVIMTVDFSHGVGVGNDKKEEK